MEDFKHYEYIFPMFASTRSRARPPFGAAPCPGVRRERTPAGQAWTALTRPRRTTTTCASVRGACRGAGRCRCGPYRSNYGDWCYTRVAFVNVDCEVELGTTPRFPTRLRCCCLSSSSSRRFAALVVIREDGMWRRLCFWTNRVGCSHAWVSEQLHFSTIFARTFTNCCGVEVQPGRSRFDLGRMHTRRGRAEST